MSYSSDLVDVWNAIRKLHGDDAAKAIVEEVKRARAAREEAQAARTRGAEVQDALR